MWFDCVMNSFFWSSGNLITHRTTLAWMYGCGCFWESRNVIVCENSVLLPQHPASRHQTELRPEWQSECRFHVNDQRAPWLCAPTTKGFTVPHDERGERIKRMGIREERGWDGRERGEATDKGYAEMKGEARGGKEEGKTEGRMAKHGWKEARKARMRDEKQMEKKRDWGRQRWRGKEEEGTIRAKMNGEIRTSGLKAS